ILRPRLLAEGADGGFVTVKRHAELRLPHESARPVGGVAKFLRLRAELGGEIEGSLHLLLRDEGIDPFPLCRGGAERAGGDGLPWRRLRCRGLGRRRSGGETAERGAETDAEGGQDSVSTRLEFAHHAQLDTDGEERRTWGCRRRASLGCRGTENLGSR